MHAVGRALLVLLLVLAASVGGIVAWAALRDPLSALPSAAEKPLATGFSTERRDGRTFHHVVLEAPEVGRIGLVINLPDPLPRQPLPVIVVLGGLATGEHNIRYITRPGENAIVGYDWPIPTRLPQGFEFVLQAPDLYQRTMRVPGQVAAALAWLTAQD